MSRSRLPLALLIGGLVLLLAACAAPIPTATPAPRLAQPTIGPAPTRPPAATTVTVAPTAPPTPAAAAQPTAATTAASAPTMAPTAAPAATANALYGRSAEGLFTYGRADAPVTIGDYSDFL